MKWSQIQAVAQSEVEATLASLPAPLEARARALPISFEQRPNRSRLEEGIEPDTLGLFVGPELADEDHALIPVPPQIILYLSNIWAHAEADDQIFRQEVRTTFLHELGHYLGLDEDGLTERGLE